MEDLIKEFLSINRSGYGYGDGSGDGSGYGDGYGSGDGSGYGSGYGDGSGDGSGYGDGYGYGYKKYRKGFLDKKIHSFDKINGNDVYYIDNIPCFILAINKDCNVAKIQIIKDDFSLEKSYIAKLNNLFAHGETSEKAIKSVNDKYFASLSFKEKKDEFIKLFNKKDNYIAKLFFDWHYFLTGSCETGRRMFVQSHNIDLDRNMSVLEFLNLTKNEYNNGIINELLEIYK